MNILRFLRDQAKEYDCSVCGANHSRSDIRVLGRHEQAWVVRVTCASCSTTFKLLVVVDENASSIPTKRDHPSASQRRRAPLSPDEVLDAHEFLRAYDGGIDGLFGPPSKESVAGRSARR
ncbi:MAG TPA: hypothetical protein VFM93_10800 [Candidatus Limnocylindria bacterium]|nr:hypothetical protein [Candidatus Limnocylindria bacterium]